MSYVFEIAHYANVCFNATLVRLKEVALLGFQVPHYGFNATLVRLKGEYGKIRPAAADDGFNATLVRLKGPTDCLGQASGYVVSMPPWFD